MFMQQTPAMANKHHLLTLPMELRCHIYSFIYLENQIVDFLRPKLHFTKTNLYLTCRQLKQETLEYYYGRNTFSLPLQQKFAVSSWHSFPRHFDLVKMLHLEAKSFLWKFPRDNVKTTQHVAKCRQRLEGYLKALFWINQGTLPPNLKTLTFAESMPTSCLWDQGIETSDERLEGYIQVFENLQIRVGQVVTEINTSVPDNGIICPICFP